MRTSEQVETEQTAALLAPFPQTTVETPFDPQFRVVEASFAGKAKVCNIIDYGAKNDGKTKNTDAFAKAIDDCAEQGGGRVLVPAGKWLTGPIHLKSDIDLHLDKDAEILFSTDLEDYLPVVFSRFEGVEYYNYSPPIYAKDCMNVAITGNGKLNGQAEKSWWKFDILSADIDKLYSMGRDNVPVEQRTFGIPWTGLRPGFVEFVNCNVVLMDGVTLVNGPMWTIHPIYSQNVIVRNVYVSTAPGRSTDGFVVDSSKNVLLEHSTFNTGDDAIVIKSGRDTDGIRVGRSSENIVVRDCNVTEAHAAFAIGSEVSGGVRNIYVKDLTIKNAIFGMRIKSAPGRRGVVENVWADGINVTASTSDAAFELNDFYEKRIVNSKDEITPFRNISVNNIVSKRSRIPFFIQGYGGDSITDVAVDGLKVLSNKNASIADASGITIRHMQLSSNKNVSPMVVIKNSQAIKFEDSDITDAEVTCTNCTYGISVTPPADTPDQQ